MESQILQSDGNLFSAKGDAIGVYGLDTLGTEFGTVVARFDLLDGFARLLLEVILFFRGLEFEDHACFPLFLREHRNIVAADAALPVRAHVVLRHEECRHAEDKAVIERLPRSRVERTRENLEILTEAILHRRASPSRNACIKMRKSEICTPF